MQEGTSWIRIGLKLQRSAVLMPSTLIYETEADSLDEAVRNGGGFGDYSPEYLGLAFACCRSTM